MKRLQRRSEMAFDGAARSGHLIGDEVSAPCRAHPIKIPARFRVRGSSDIATAADMHSAAVARHYAAASFSFFSARAFTRTLAGFAGNQRSSPENGSLPKRFFFAGTTCAVIFSRPGSVNSPAPFL